MGGTGPGDPLTPGFPSSDGIYRQPLNESGLPTIPAFELSYGDAEEILRRMKGEFHTAFSRFFFWRCLQRWLKCRQNCSDRLSWSLTSRSSYVLVFFVLWKQLSCFACFSKLTENGIPLPYAITVLLISFSWWINTVFQWDYFNQSHPRHSV